MIKADLELAKKERILLDAGYKIANHSKKDAQQQI
jgi:hypothetical protein